MKKLYFLILGIIWLMEPVFAQTTPYNGTVIDNLTKEPVIGATLSVRGKPVSQTDVAGAFNLLVNPADTIRITCAGYKVWMVLPSQRGNRIELEQEVQMLKEIVVTSGRAPQVRKEFPVAISMVGVQTMKESKPTSLDQVLNKTSGVFMVNLGNEQHQMSIRQPMTTKSLFLYLEDGIPVRTTGLYNHNALLEMNMAATRQIEVIRGPASALYGAEAIGGAINVITQAPPAFTTGSASIQGNTDGYKRTDIQLGSAAGKFSYLVSGYYAQKADGRLQHSDFNKVAITLKGNYNFNARTSLASSLTFSDYFSDMFGALDSSRYSRKDFSSLYSFTYRKVNALRFKSQLQHKWNDAAQSKAAFVYRDNTIEQNPSYRIRNDYRRLSNGTSTGDPLKAHGEINANSYRTFALFLQHDQRLNWQNGKLTAGINADLSPSDYNANYIGIEKDAAGYFKGYSATDSLLSNYSTDIKNLASYLNYSMNLTEGLKLVAALRYDFYHYNYRNFLTTKAFSGAPSTKQHFQRVTPKLGLTYNYRDLGFYLNYSQGFVPPQISEMFQGVKVPFLMPQTFFNYEVGGWSELFDRKVYADWSLYKMNGTNEIISVLAEDGTYENRNAGKTSHLGVEYGFSYFPSSEWTLRLSASNALHQFVDYAERGQDYSGNIMAGAPRFQFNTEVSYKPAFIKGLRTSLELQHQGSYWMDNANTRKYGGFDLINARAGYAFQKFEVWLNALNLTNRYYSVNVSKSGSGYGYNLGEPRTFTTGISYTIGKK
ncbi:MAG TPA: TonB-dependent receptor [Sphingobacteriaceae bacterium]